MIPNAMLFLLKTQCIMLYNILFEFIFGKTDTYSVLRTPGVILQFLEIIRFINIMSVTAW